MKQNCFFVVLCLLLVTQMHPIQCDNLRGKKIEDLIPFESNAIMNAQNLEDRVNAILSRAESYLLCGDEQKAISDYETAFALINSFDKSSDENIFFSFRGNFGLMIAYLNENRERHAWECYNLLTTILDELPCDGHPSKYDNFAHKAIHHMDDQNDSRILLADRPIEGPDRIPLQNCLELVSNTEKFCRILISYVKHSGAQVSLHLLIDGLAGSAKDCCLAGGLWKACLGPLLQKWSNWDQRWQVLRLPPDPAND